MKWRGECNQWLVILVKETIKETRIAIAVLLFKTISRDKLNNYMSVEIFFEMVICYPTNHPMKHLLLHLGQNV